LNRHFQTFLTFPQDVQPIRSQKRQSVAVWWAFLLLGLVLSGAALYFVAIAPPSFSLMKEYHPFAILLTGFFVAEFGGILLGLLLAASCCLIAKQMVKHWRRDTPLLSGSEVYSVKFVRGMQRTSCLAVGAALVCMGSIANKATDALLYLSAFGVVLRVLMFSLKYDSLREPSSDAENGSRLKMEWKCVGMGWVALAAAFISFTTFGAGRETGGVVEDLQFGLPLVFGLSVFLTTNVVECAVWASCYDNSAVGLQRISSSFRDQDDLSEEVCNTQLCMIVKRS
jgi:hypothetical protein